MVLLVSCILRREKRFFFVLNQTKFRSGELASEFEKRRQDMQQAEEDTTFNYQKKKVTHNLAMVLDMIL